jgi:ABC-2 type transport system ATP-binding protein
MIRLTDLTKRYGKFTAVDSINLEIRRGELFGFLGPNGAGKTTTIRLLLGLLRPTAGTVSAFGLDAHRQRRALHTRLGYLPGDLQLYEHLSARRQLGTFAAMAGVDTSGRVSELAERLQLDLDVPTGSLSRGNRQKVGLVAAFARDAELLVLDEPTSGLDPIMQQVFGELVREAAAAGRTVLLSSHQLAEVQRLVDRVAIMRDGRLILVEDVGVLRARALRRVELHFAAPAPAEAFAGLPGVRVVDAGGERLRLAVQGPLDAVVKTAARFEVIDLSTQEADLDEVFLHYYRDTVEVSA